MKKQNLPSYTAHDIEVLGSNMHYLEQGSGDPILFLHGVPTSSYLWRNVIPHLAPLGRCIALDLIGMGKSDKPDIEYSILDHIKYVNAFIEKLNLKRITLVMHGWGSIIGCHYAMEHEKNCRGLVFYESYLRPLNSEDISLPYQEQILSLQEHDLMSQSTYFVDTVLPQTMIRPLSQEELTHYREPYLQKTSAKPLQTYLKELPRGEGNGKVDQLIAEYSKKLMQSHLPKLLLYSIPGFITTVATLMWAKKHLPNLELIEIGEELHYAQESNPNLMGEMISAWLQAIEQQSVKMR